MTIPESDWKKFKILRQKALARFCDSILDEIEQVQSGAEGSSHEKYLKIYNLIRDRDKTLGNIFDQFSRSRALLQLGMMQSHKLISSEEIAEFSETTKKYLESLEYL